LKAGGWYESSLYIGESVSPSSRCFRKRRSRFKTIMKYPVTLAIAGAGKRGEAYAAYALAHPDLAKIVAVAEPRRFQRENMAQTHAIPERNVLHSWTDLADKPQLADAVLICTQDRMHLEPVQALAPKGYAILLEKPMSTELSECELIVTCVKKHGNLFAVGHVLRYTQFTKKLKAMLASGAIGDIVSVQHLEPVGWWHQAHSFVRGHWRNEKESSSMLLAKSCHDLDWIRHMMDRPCGSVASFGSLRHFRASERPSGAADRCLDCRVEAQCPYSAKRFYLDQFGRDKINDYCVSVITDDHTRDGVARALREGPYGRCVYACDNDVVDNQVVALQFADGATANFTMTAFTPTSHRQTRIFGTRGHIEADGEKITAFDFVTERETVTDTSGAGDSATAASGHGGGDYGLMKAFVEAVATGDQGKVWSGPDETLASHRLVFAAERARCERRVVSLNEPFVSNGFYQAMAKLNDYKT
jgi:predicted dehydrogenase